MNKWLVVVIVLHILILASLRFTAWPEMLLWPYLLSKGWLPYQDFAMVHTPLLPIVSSFILKQLGFSLVSLQFVTWTLIVIIDCLIYLTTSRLFSRHIAIITVLFYSLLHIRYEGNALWFDLALVPFLLIYYYCLESKKFLFAGFVWMLAIMTKQTAVWFLLPLAFYLIPAKSIKPVIRFSLGILALAVPVFLLITSTGILPDFYYWAIHFGTIILPSSTGQISLPSLKQLFSGLWPYVSLVFIIYPGVSTRSIRLIVWGMVGMLGAFPRWELFHFQPALPFLSIIFAVIITSLQRRSLVRPLFSLYLLFSALWLVKPLIRDTYQPARFFEPAVYSAVREISQHTSPSDTIFVLNYWDHLYALSDHLPPKPWIPQLPWYQSLPGIQDKQVSALTSNPPSLVVFHPYEQSGLGAFRPKMLSNYLLTRYQLASSNPDYHLLLPVTPW